MALTLSPEDLAAVADAVWDEVLTGATHNVPTSAGRRLRQLSSAVIIEVAVVSATTNTVTFNGDASTADGAYDPAAISIVEGTGAGQTRLIFEYTGSTKTALIDRDWKVTPDNTSIAIITAHPGREHVNEGRAQGGSANTIRLNPLASANNDEYVGQVVFIRSGTGSDQACRITAYNGTTKDATVERNWGTPPAAGSGYVILPTAVLDTARLIDAFWANSERTLTIPVSAVLSSVMQGPDISIKRGENITIDITGMGSLTDRTKLRFTVKTSYDLPDSAAILQIEETAGLDVLNGVAVTENKNRCSLVVADASAGDIRVTIKTAISEQLPIITGALYDVQKTVSGEGYTCAEGKFEVAGDITRTI